MTNNYKVELYLCTCLIRAFRLFILGKGAISTFTNTRTHVATTVYTAIYWWDPRGPGRTIVPTGA